jgi:hypothetical protein
MAKYITRVELHRAAGPDYDRLHLFMAARAFGRTIVSDDGIEYELPTATYFSHGTASAFEVRALATAAAAATGKAADVLVTEAGNICWQLRPVNTLAAAARSLGLRVAPLSVNTPSW